MEDVSNARVTVSTPPDVKLYSRELNATEGAVVYHVYSPICFQFSDLAKVRATPLNPELV
ncbi:hypothetical protein YC2023_010248 [Brassica napus]|uniref:Uncharacterized protein n=1 Tax=Brassica oleracea TaxID=3712 RepID=A0A3P6FU98_BRAOL|nr:unnamed protein product [Brassica oleracea]